MSTPLDVMAEEIRRGCRECGSVRFWGALMMAPHEVIFDVARVEVHQRRLMIVLRAQDDGAERLVGIENPQGVRVGKDKLVVESATMLLLDGSECRPRADDKPPALTID